MPFAVPLQNNSCRRKRRTHPGVTAKDIILAIIGKVGIDGGNGHIFEYGGAAIRALSMEGRHDHLQHDHRRRRSRRNGRARRQQLSRISKASLSFRAEKNFGKLLRSGKLCRPTKAQLTIKSSNSMAARDSLPSNWGATSGRGFRQLDRKLRLRRSAKFSTSQHFPEILFRTERKTCLRDTRKLFRRRDHSRHKPTLNGHVADGHAAFHRKHTMAAPPY